MIKKTSTKSAQKTNSQATPQSRAEKPQPQVVIDNTKLKLTVTWTDIKTEYDQVLKQAAKNIKAQGFRQGKVPLKIAEGKIGQERLINQVLEKLVPSKYQELIKTTQKEPLTPPEIRPLKMEWGQDFELEIQIAEKPLIKLGKYQTSVKKGLKAAAQQLQEQKKAQEKAKQAAKKSQEKNAEKPTPELTKEQLIAREREIKLQQIFKTLVEDLQPQIPELLLKEETKREIQRLSQELKKIGLSLDDYLARRKQKFEEMSSQVAAQALGQLQIEFILAEIGQELKIKTSQAELDEELKKITDKKMKQQIQGNHQYQHYLEAQISRRKLLDALLEIK